MRIDGGTENHCSNLNKPDTIGGKYLPASCRPTQRVSGDAIVFFKMKPETLMILEFPPER